MSLKNSTWSTITTTFLVLVCVALLIFPAILGGAGKVFSLFWFVLLNGVTVLMNTGSVAYAKNAPLQIFGRRNFLSIEGYSDSEQFLEIYRKKSYKLSFLFRRIKSGDAQFDRQFVIDCFTPELKSLFQNNATFRAQIQSIFSNANLQVIRFSKSYFQACWQNLKDDAVGEKETLNKIQLFAAKYLTIGPSCKPSWRRNVWLCSFLAVLPLFITVIITIIVFKPPQAYSTPVILTDTDYPYHIFYSALFFVVFLLFVSFNIKIPENFGFRYVMMVYGALALGFFISISSFLSNKILTSNWDLLLSKEIAKIPVVITNFDWHLKCPDGGEQPNCASIRVPYAVISFDESVKAKYSNILKFEGLQILTYLPLQQPSNPDNHLVVGVQPAVTLVVTKGLLGRTYIKEVIFDEKHVRLSNQDPKL